MATCSASAVTAVPVAPAPRAWVARGVTAGGVASSSASGAMGATAAPVGMVAPVAREVLVDSSQALVAPAVMAVPDQYGEPAVSVALVACWV